MTALHSAIAALAETRAALAGLTETLARAREAWNTEHEAEIASAALLQKAVTRQEAEVRALALTSYRDTGETHPAPGVSIRLFERLTYSDAEALAWAKTAGLAVIPEALDRKAFERIAKAAPLAFVTYADEPRALIASDLDGAIDGEHGTAAETGEAAA